MIKHFKILSCIVLTGTLLYSCKNSTNNDEVMWAELVESKTNVIKPEGFQDEYWRSVNQNVDYSVIFNTIVEAVLKGEKKAYDILSNNELNKSDIENLMGFEGDVNKITISDLSAIRMREEWFFNEKDFSLTKKVKRIDLLLKKIDPTTGEYLGDKALFYIKLDE